MTNKRPKAHDQASTSSTTPKQNGQRLGQAHTRALLTTDDAARRLSISSGMLRKLVRMGEIPKVKIGSLVRFDETDLSEWIASMKVVEPPGCP